jgi:Bacterial toxin 8
VRGWIRQELNAIAPGQRKRIRVPPGYELAHRYGQEARLGFGYEFSDLKDILMHRSQHRIERELGR